MATDHSQPPPYSQVGIDDSKDLSKVLLNTSSPPQYSSSSPPPYSASNPPLYTPSAQCKPQHKQYSVNSKSKRKESFKELEHVNPETTEVYKKNNNQRKIFLGVGALVIIGVAALIIVFCCNHR